MNIVCVICSDLLSPSDDIFYTPCGHIFHFACVTQWLERSRTCPQCREKVTQSKIHRIYFNFSNNDTIVEDATSLQSMVDTLKFQVMLKETEVKNTRVNSDKYKKENAGLRAEVKRLEDQICHKDTAILALKEQSRFLKEQTFEVENAKKEVIRLKKKLDELRSVQMLLNAPTEDIDHMISSQQDPATLITYITVMKRELTTSVARRKELRTSLKKVQQDLSKVSMERNFLSDEHEKRRHLEEMLAIAETEKYALQARLREYENGSRQLKSCTGRKKINDETTDEQSSKNEESKVEENAFGLHKSSDIIDLNEDLPFLNKKTTSKNDDAVILPTNDERGKSNDENCLRGIRYNITSDMMKRKSRLNVRTYSILAKKPRLAQTNSTESLSTDLTYDGFGGHAKDDKFPSPKRFGREQKKLSRIPAKKPTFDVGTNKKIADFVSID